MIKETMTNLEQLTQEIRTMSIRSKLYKVLKTELKAQGHWKELPRNKKGNPDMAMLLYAHGRKHKNLPE